MVKIPDEQLKELLIKDGIITDSDFDSVLKDSQRMGQSVADILISRNLLRPDYYNNLLSKYFGVAPANLAQSAIDENLLKLLPEDISRSKKVILFKKEKDGAIAAAMEDPTDLSLIEFLTSRLKLKIKPYLATPEDLNKGFAFYGRRSADEFKKIIEENIKTSLQSQLAGKQEKEAALDFPIVSIVDNLMSYALASRASDIHLEILEDFLLTRYRIDGVLHEIVRMPKEVDASIVARIKLLSGLRLDEHSKPQDGRFRYQAGEAPIDVRVSTIPTFYGEKIEMRLLSATNRPLSFEELGMMEDAIKVVRNNIAKTYGIVLVTGPTGSGKSTTLYSMLNVLNKPEVNISTIEDPIEYNMKYINQTQVNPAAGITFSSGLRALLRQDPNVIMVGEIRDGETAEIAVQASLTGHLVLSTLHTNDAPSAIPRLFDMKVEPFLAAATVNTIMAQRLVRKICLDCIVSYPVTAETVKTIKGQFKSLGIEREYKAPKMFYKGAGCPACGNIGYKSRFGIFEIFDVDESVRKAIIDPNFDLGEFKKMIRGKGMVSMFEDGLRKVEKGLTTIEEVLRVIRE